MPPTWIVRKTEDLGIAQPGITLAVQQANSLADENLVKKFQNSATQL